MKLQITDLASDCFPEHVMIGQQDSARNARIKERVMGELHNDARRKRRASGQIFSIVLVAALIIALSVTASATGLFGLKPELMERAKVEAQWDGRNVTLSDVGLVFTFDSAERPNQVEFKPGWLPSQPTPAGRKTMAAVDWNQYMADYGDGDNGNHIPWLICVYYAKPNFSYMLAGDCTVIKTEMWDELQVTEVELDYTFEKYHDRVEHYLFLFSETYGYLITIGGTDDWETLEHIARELEIRVTDRPYEYWDDASEGFTYGSLNLGLG